MTSASDILSESDGLESDYTQEDHDVMYIGSNSLFFLFTCTHTTPSAMSFQTTDIQGEVAKTCLVKA